MFKNLLLIIIIANLLVVPKNSALSEIIPLKKPLQTIEEEQNKLSIDILKPLPKPLLKSKLENTEEKIDVISCLNLRGFFNTVDNYEEHSKLLDKASTLIVDVLGSEHGKHSRLAIGCASLPKNSPVEIEAIFSIL